MTSSLREVFDDSAIGARVDGLIQSAGLGRVESARKAGISRQTLQEALNGRITRKVAWKIANGFGTTVDFILTGSTGSSEASLDEAESEAPAVMKGLSQPVRVFVQEFLLEITKAGATEREISAARRSLTSPETMVIYVGGEPREMTEDQILKGMNAHADVIRLQLRKRGRKIPK